MLRGLYDRVVELSKGKHALPALAGVSFAESSFFPIPPDVILIPMALANPEQGEAVRARLHCRLGAWRHSRLRHRRVRSSTRSASG